MKPHPTAIGFIPANHPNDGKFAQRVIDYARNRGYGAIALLRGWPLVEAFLADRRADLVVLPAGTYGVRTHEVTQPLNRPGGTNRGGTTARYEVAKGVTRAVIYLPAGTPVDGPDAQRCLAHVEAHEYELIGIVHTRGQITEVFRSGTAAVCVLARREHRDPLWEPRIEVAGEDLDDETPRPTPQAKSNEKNAGRNRGRRPRVLG